jgi:DNA-binding NarL/FixJ family response regulator
VTVTATAELTVRVLTVDDQAPFRAAARAVVGALPGFEVVAECEDGESAVEVARRVDPDLVLLDVRLTGIDGIETARRLSADNCVAVIVLVTSMPVSGLSMLSASCGAAALVLKQWLTPRLLHGLWVAHRRR